MDAISKLFREVAAVRREVRGLAGGVQLAYSSIENGAVDSVDADGNVVMQIGAQPDGTNTVVHVDGPVPGKPSQPAVKVDGPVLTVSWDGQSADGSPLLLDYQRVQVFASMDSDVLGPVVGSISPKGASTLVTANKSGTWFVGLKIESAAGKVSAVSDLTSVDVKLVDLAGALDVVQGSVNRVNNNYWSPTAPTKPVGPAFVVGDAWFQTSDSGIVAWFQWDGLAWAPRVLDRTLIPQIDIGEGTFGSLSGARLEVNSVQTGQLSSDAIDGMVVTGATIRTAVSGARVQMDADGLSVFDDTDDWKVRLSADLSVFKGDVEADSLVVNGAAEFRSDGNLLGAGSVLSLTAGQVDPTAPATVQPYWDSWAANWSASGLNEDVGRGLAFDGTSYWSVLALSGWYLPDGKIGASFSMNATTGEVKAYVTPSLSGGTDHRYGVTCIGSELFWLYRRGYKAYVVVTDLSMNPLREWEYTAFGYSASNPLNYLPGIGTDGTNVVIAQCLDSGNVVWRTYNKMTGAEMSFVQPSGDQMKSNITGVYIGQGDWGETKVVIAKESQSKLVVYTTAGAWKSDQAWYNQNNANDTGIVYVNGAFKTLASNGAVTSYADKNTGDAASTWWATYRWQNTDGSYSRISKGRKFTWPRRAAIRIVPSAKPDNVTGAVWALASKSTTPGRTDYHLPATATPQATPMITSLPTNWASTASPADSNTYPDSTPGKIRSGSGTFEVDGRGFGKWGALQISSTNGFKADTGDASITLDSRISMSASAANMGEFTYNGSDAAWNMWFSKGTDRYGAIGSPSRIPSGSFGIAAYGTHDLTIAARTTASLTLKGTGDPNAELTAAGWKWSGIQAGSGTAMNITSSGWIQKNSSARKYKILERPLTVDYPDLTDRLLSLVAKTWFDKTAADRWAEVEDLKAKYGDDFDRDKAGFIPDALVRYPGLVAEDLVEAGLDLFVIFGPDGEPESIHYDRLAAALIPVLQQVVAEVKDLRSLVSQQGDRITALEVA